MKLTESKLCSIYGVWGQLMHCNLEELLRTWHIIFEMHTLARGAGCLAADAFWEAWLMHMDILHAWAACSHGDATWAVTSLRRQLGDGKIQRHVVEGRTQAVGDAE